MRPIRLLRSIPWSKGSGGRQVDDLTVRRHVHLEPLPHDRLQPAAAGRVANRALELDRRGHERLPPSLEVAQDPRVREAVAPPPDDARGYEDETNEQHRGEAAAPPPYSPFRHARSLALRERGLRASSSAVGVTAFRVISLPSGLPRQVQTGWGGGDT